MKKKKYNIHPDFKFCPKLPFSPFILRAASFPQKILLLATPIPSGIKHEQRVIKGSDNSKLCIDIYEPEKSCANMPCLLYLHGGGFGYRAAPHHKKLACIYAKEAACKVIFPDYHLLPSHPYPDAKNEALLCLKWINDNAENLGIDANRIAIGGDSAGGALACYAANQWQDCCDVKPCLQMLIYPVTNSEMNTASMAEFTDTPMWNSKNNAVMWDLYLKNASENDITDASPLLAPLPTEIPDTYLETAEFDCLRDEGLLYAQRLRKAGANVVLNQTSGTVHGYDFCLKSDISQESIKKRVHSLKKAFEKNVQ